ncbi:MAG TPA: aldolase/citrate lyase family protein, partial [Actinomycetota bacterium]
MCAVGDQRSVRPRRSCLSVPGSSPKMLAKAPGLPADEVFMDLEDSVAPGAKEEARANIVQALQEGDWAGKTVVVRVNGVSTKWCYRDVIEVVEAAGDVLDTVLVPKVGSASDVEFVGTLLDQMERTRGWEPARIGIHILIETARGMAN